MNDNSIHQTCFLAGKNNFGSGIRMARRCNIAAWVSIGDNCTLGEYVRLDDNAKIGDGCVLKDHVHLCDAVELEDDVYCGSGCVIADGLPPRAKSNTLRSHGTPRTALVKRGASIGSNATINGGVTIGEWALIAPGAVIASDVPSHAFMIGNPAVQRGWVCECGRVLPVDLVCEKCGCAYAISSDGLSKV